MSTRVLTVLDTTGIQEYIFGSNRLRENITASYLVEQATCEWMVDSLPAPHNLSPRSCAPISDSWTLEDDSQRRAELIYRGGGNVVLMFRSLDDARAMVARLTQRVLRDAPGLELAVAHHKFEWEEEAVGGEGGAYERAMGKLREAKLRRPGGGALLGQGVTLACRSTGLPAVGVDPEEPGRPVSSVVAPKVDRVVRELADERLARFLREADCGGVGLEHFDLSRDLDELGRSRGEMSYIAVVHADGNRMGERFTALARRYANSAANRECLLKLRAMSAALEQAGRVALGETVCLLLRALRDDAFADLVYGLSQRHDARGGIRHLVLPIRPLVFGGDDVTFVCDGRLGLELAALYLEAFSLAARDLPDGEPGRPKPGHASAGIAIVKTHYPFARAYQLSKELCDEAKNLARAGDDCAALDWYCATTGISADLERLRERLYSVHADLFKEKVDGKLHMRPLRLRSDDRLPGDEHWRTWDNFSAIAGALHDPNGPWYERRNKVLALREALRQGPQAVRRFRTMYTVDQLPGAAGLPSDARQTGWDGDRCVYFDAIEALDFTLPITIPQAAGQP
jgi:hypothetical protein